MITWATFKEYLSWNDSYKIIEINEQVWELSECSCQYWKKNYICKHVIGISYKLSKFDTFPALDLNIEQNSKRGRRKKASSALQRNSTGPLNRDAFNMPTQLVSNRLMLKHGPRSDGIRNYPKTSDHILLRKSIGWTIRPSSRKNNLNKNRHVVGRFWIIHNTIRPRSKILGILKFRIKKIRSNISLQNANYCKKHAKYYKLLCKNSAILQKNSRHLKDIRKYNLEILNRKRAAWLIKICSHQFGVRRTLSDFLSHRRVAVVRTIVNDTTCVAVLRTARLVKVVLTKTFLKHQILLRVQKRLEDGRVLQLVDSIRAEVVEKKVASRLCLASHTICLTWPLETANVVLRRLENESGRVFYARCDVGLCGVGGAGGCRGRVGQRRFASIVYFVYEVVNDSYKLTFVVARVVRATALGAHKLVNCYEEM
ncbi:hypothetical protein BpHYR1_021522 [Brachionus plicatilis]|uniref:SWIM-type domain-containing protein n=1 Tax=Brachionus plicatilis TaxID=10195 RepID=A0A3M7SF46_BRAPC|nr:hypothetical protein BpHYR1_021522 [Brachionus plicatilis]